MKPLLTALFISLSLPAFALPPLSQNKDVTEGLITVGMALELSENCDGLSARVVRGLFYLNGLKNRAKSAGYSDTQIDAFVDDKAEKAKLESIARSRLAALGVEPGNGASYCAVGRDQIAAGTDTGRLLSN